MGQIEQGQAWSFMRKFAVLTALLSVLVLATACSDGEKTTGAQLIDDSNRALIGMEIVAQGTEPSASLVDRREDLSADGIITGPASPDILAPSTVVEFLTPDGKTPEIMMTNGDCAVFSQDENDGWPCAAGDLLSFAFEKYPSEVISNQTFIVGYIRDGILHEGKQFPELAGTYQLEISEAGNYQIYVISATSDYLALKEGTIALSE